MSGRPQPDGAPRGAAWGLAVLAVLVAGVPLIAGLAIRLGERPSAAGGDLGALPSPGGTPGEIAVRTIAWAAGAAIVAILLGWLPGRRLGRSTGRPRACIAALVLLPVAMPAYAVFHAWWQAWPVGSDLHQWIVARDLVPAARAVTLAMAFGAWSWPIVAICVAPAAAEHDRRRDEALRLDAQSRWARGRTAARAEWPAAIVGGLVVFVLVAGNTTAFDLAQVYAIGNELRAMDALGRPPAELIAVGGPFLLLATAAAAAAWAAARPGRRGGRGGARATANESARPGRVSSAVLAVVLAAGLLVPLTLAVGGLPRGLDVRTFLDLNGPGLVRSLVLAGSVAACAAGIALAAALAIAGHARTGVRVAGLLLLGAMLVPGFLLVAGLESAWNRGWPWGDAADGVSPAALVYRTSAIVLLAGIARAAAPAILLARWAADGRSVSARDLERLDAPRGIGGRLRSLGPRVGGAAGASAALAFVLVLADATVVARLAPPGFDPIAVALLNAMHYQRADTVLLGLVVIVGAAAVAASAVALALEGGRRGGGVPRSRAPMLAIAALPAVVITTAIGLGGCDARAPGPADEHGVVPLPSPVVHGMSGTGAGQFSYPRAIAADPAAERVYVIDKTARVQVFDGQGRHQLHWRMPEFDQGKPTGISVGPDGTVWVADTHENRVIAFDGQGRERLRFGGPGTGPGEFVYPTDVAVGADGRLYVSEYGGNDRIQVFEPDGTFIRSFGVFGEGPGAFNRPQALLFSPDRRRLYVADSCNHRIVVVDPATGSFESTLGGPGLEPGRFHYPYDITWFDEDVLLVSEFGNNRIQLVRTDGTSLGSFGGVGAEPGRLKYPWGAVRVGSSVHILDSGNNRLQQVPARRLR